MTDQAKAHAPVDARDAHALLERLGIVACPDCGRAVQANPQSASGWIAECGRRIATIEEVGFAQCSQKGTSPIRPTAGAAGGGSGDLGALSAACKPWEFCAGDPPEYDSPLHQVFVAGMLYSEKLLAGFLDVETYEPGDGSEDFDQDATKSLENILTVAGLYDPEEGRKATLTPTPDLGAQGEPVKATDQRRWEDGFRSIVTIVHGPRSEFTIPEIVEKVRTLAAPTAPRTGSGVSVEEIAEAIGAYRKTRAKFGATSQEATVERAKLYDLEEQLRDSLALIAQAPRDGGVTQGGWQPIKTAPKEQQPIMLALDRGRYGDISRAPVIAFWSEIQNDWRMWSAGGSIGATPTHWRPLPTPPSGVETIRQGGEQ